jgi:hypothetical protein
VAFVPANITVPAGSKAATFTVTTSYTTSTLQDTVTAFYNGVSKTAALTVTPASALSSVSVNPTSVTGGSSATGTVTLTLAAPAGGLVIQLWTNGAPAFVPASITIPAGSKTGTFTVTTNSISSTVQDTVTAFYLGATKTTILTVTP